MTDIIEEARAMLAESAKYSSHPWSVRGTVHTIVWDARGLDVAEAATSEDAALIAAAPRLLAALADECERLRAENARLREAMIDVAYWERCRAHEDTVEGTYSPYTRDEYAREFHDDLLARLDAAKGVR